MSGPQLGKSDRGLPLTDAQLRQWRRAERIGFAVEVLAGLGLLFGTVVVAVVLVKFAAWIL